VKHQRDNHRFLKVIGLVAVLGLAAVGLSQCRFVSDSVTGLDLKSATGLSAKSDCVRSCNEFFKDAIRQETERHKDALKACGKDKGCKDAEEALFKANKSKIKDGKKQCKGGCYNEGGGGGGR
jgi:hypothetical protein